MIDCLSLRMITGLLPQPLDRKDTALDKLTLSMRVQRVKPSPTLAVTARVAELRAAGFSDIDVIMAAGVNLGDAGTVIEEGRKRVAQVARKWNEQAEEEQEPGTGAQRNVA